MPLSHEVRIYNLTSRANRRRGHGVRWHVAGRQFSKWFEYRAQADSYRSRLMHALRRGEGFDTGTGQPESVVRERQSVTWYELACRYVDLKWPHAAAKTRTSTADALATVTPVMVASDRGKPGSAALRAALYGWAFHKTRRETVTLDGAAKAALAWVRDNSLKITVLDENERRSALIRRALDTLALTLDGRPAAATTVARKRAVFYGVLGYAVELDILPANPIDKVTWKAPDVAEEVDRRVVASPRQVRALLAAVAEDHPELAAFFGCLYYGFLRPGEAVLLREANCAHLPDSGWGLLLLSESVYVRAWQQARDKALTPAQADSPLAGRPYDLRHSGVTLALNAGVPAPEVARRAGHSVEVLLRVYAGCVDGQDPLWNGRIDDALRDDDEDT